MANIPNLDCMEPDDLWALFETSRTRKAAREMFPDRPTGYVSATINIAHYACNKSVAMKLRAAGDIATAEVYETICQRIYAMLPEWARW